MSETSDTTIESLFPSLRLERTEAGTRLCYQDAQGLLDNILTCFHSQLPDVSCEVPEDSPGIELTLKEPDPVVRFVEALLLCFLEENCRKKALRATMLGKRLSQWELEEAVPPEVRESLAPVIRKLLPLAAAQGVTLIPLPHPRLGAFTFWAASSGDYDGLETSEATLARRDTVPVLEITLDRAGDWLIEERPAVTTGEFLQELRKAKRRQKLVVAVVIVVIVLLGLAYEYFEDILGWLMDWEKLKEWLRQSGYGWLAVVVSAALAAWVAWGFLGDRIHELMSLFGKMPFKLRVFLLGLLAAGVAALIWLWSGKEDMLSFEQLIVLSALLGGVVAIGARWQRRWERKSPEYRAFLADEELSFGRTIRQGTAVFMSGLSASGWRGCSGEVKVTTQGLLFYADEAKPGARKLFVPLGAIVHCRRTGRLFARNQQTANLSHVETHDQQTLVIQMEAKLHRALVRLLRDSEVVTRCACGREMRVARDNLTNKSRCPACGNSVPMPAAGSGVVVIKPADESDGRSKSGAVP